VKAVHPVLTERLSFGAGDLQQYRRFVEVLGDFRRYFGLEALTFREIDKYLWRLGTT